MGGEKVEILLSLSSTSMAPYSCVTFAAAALADDGVGDNSVWRWRLSRSGCFSYDTGDGNAAGAEPLADTLEMIVWLTRNLLAQDIDTPEVIAWLRQSLLARNTDTPEIT